MTNWFFGILIATHVLDVCFRIWNLLKDGKPPQRSVGEYAGDAVANTLIGLWAYFVWSSLQ